MDLFAFAARSMSMDDAVWRRHANPWSVWTRFTTLPLISAAVWSRVWWGWGAAFPVALALLWVYLNPRVFPPPARLDTWASKGTLGERVFLAHRRSLPVHHLRAAHALTLLSLGALPIWLWGLWSLDVWATVAGVLGIGLPKAWFVDRMVWVYDDHGALLAADADPDSAATD